MDPALGVPAGGAPPATGMPAAHRRFLFWLAVGAALLLRLLIAWVEPGNTDTDNYLRVARTLLAGGRLYADTPGLYPYPPPWALCEALAALAAQRSGLPFLFVVKLPPIAADLGIVLLLHALAPAGRGRRDLTALLYAFNPVAILISAVHGQFDALPVMLALLALLRLRQGRPAGAALALMGAIALKSYPVLLLPLFVARLDSWRRRLRFAALAIVPVVLLLLPFLCSEPGAVGRQLFGYSGVPDQGLGVVVRLMAGAAPDGRAAVQRVDAALRLSKWLFLLGYALAVGRLCRRGAAGPRTPLERDIALIYALFYSLYAGISSQYLLWLLPFLLLLDRRAALAYSGLAAASLTAFYAGFYPAMLAATPLGRVPAGRAAAAWAGLTLAWWLWSVGWLARRRPSAVPRPATLPVAAASAS